jgi:hypothetical protein
VRRGEGCGAPTRAACGCFLSKGGGGCMDYRRKGVLKRLLGPRASGRKVTAGGSHKTSGAGATTVVGAFGGGL